MSIDVARLNILREKAGDGSTDFFVEIRQSDLAALLDPCARAGHHLCGPDPVPELRRTLHGDEAALAALDRLVEALYA